MDAATARVARSIIDNLLRVAWDKRHGGFYLAGSAFGPLHLEGTRVFLKQKVWWPQADGLCALLGMARDHPGEPPIDYMSYFLKLWSYVETYLIDAKRGGWRARGSTGSVSERRQPKATRWKDASHEIEALVFCLGLLDRA